MPKPLRLQIAAEYLALLEKHRGRKKALAVLKAKYGFCAATIYNYVREMRGQKLSKS